VLFNQYMRMAGMDGSGFPVWDARRCAASCLSQSPCVQICGCPTRRASFTRGRRGEARTILGWPFRKDPRRLCRQRELGFPQFVSPAGSVVNPCGRVIQENLAPPRWREWTDCRGYMKRGGGKPSALHNLLQSALATVPREGMPPK